MDHPVDLAAGHFQPIHFGPVVAAQPQETGRNGRDRAGRADDLKAFVRGSVGIGGETGQHLLEIPAHQGEPALVVLDIGKLVAQGRHAQRHADPAARRKSPPAALLPRPRWFRSAARFRAGSCAKDRGCSAPVGRPRSRRGAYCARDAVPAFAGTPAMREPCAPSSCGTGVPKLPAPAQAAPAWRSCR